MGTASFRGARGARLDCAAVSESCSAASLRLEEPLAGSAGAADVVIWIAWPKPLWHPDDVLLSTGLPDAVREGAASLRRRAGKLAVRTFQRDAHPPTERVEVIAWRPRERLALRGNSVPIAEALGFATRALEGAVAADPLPPLLLVCTDGRHDRCCAEHGRPVFEAIAAEAVRRGSPFELAESSHLGGHRFAATCVLLPDGRTHGRLRTHDAPALLAALEGAGPLAARYRGRAGLDEPEQVAEAWAWARFPGATSVEIERAGTGCALRVRSAEGERTARVALAERDLLCAVSCGEDTPELRRRWVVAES